MQNYVGISLDIRKYLSRADDTYTLGAELSGCDESS